MNDEKIITDLLGTDEATQMGLEKMVGYRQKMMCYQCAMLEVKTKLDVLNAELSQDSDMNPIESIKCRLKTPLSILEKIKRKGLPFELDSLDELNDIAGVRVICSFLSDIYVLRNYLVRQDDVEVVHEKDYIAHPKPNGYRSLHLLLSIPIFLSNEKKYMHVEVQFRTIAMDFWASNEHKLAYKQDGTNDPEVVAALAKCAAAINHVDMAMQEIRSSVQGSVDEMHNK
jgi:putative GTP pyrophosphokinase